MLLDAILKCLYLMKYQMTHTSVRSDAMVHVRERISTACEGHSVRRSCECGEGDNVRLSTTVVAKTYSHQHGDAGAR